MPTAAPPSHTFSLVGQAIDFLVTADKTQGQMALMTILVAPHDPGPPLHTHTREDETFYVLEGELVFTVDGKDRTVRQGDCVFGPRNVRHKFRNDTGKPARAVIVVNPAADDGFYGYVHTVGEKGAPTGPPSEAHIKNVLDNGPRFGIQFHL